MIDPRYLGDGVYVQMDNTCCGHIILTTGSYVLEQAQTTIYFSPNEINLLKQFLNDMEKQDAPNRSS